jgi:ribose 1,5-bisphosphokinase
MDAQVRGRLVYVMGPSGSGKDTIMQRGREAVAGSLPVVFAHRYITRPEGMGGENHVALSEKDFELRRERGLFALHWRSHGWSYGLGVEMDAWLAAGLNVVMNGSREYFPTALDRYPDMVAVLVSVEPDVLRERLAARGRENAAGIEARLERALNFPVSRDGLVVIDNSGSLEDAVSAFSAMLGDLACACEKS